MDDDLTAPAIVLSRSCAAEVVAVIKHILGEVYSRLRKASSSHIVHQGSGERFDSKPSRRLEKRDDQPQKLSNMQPI